MAAAGTGAAASRALAQNPGATLLAGAESQPTARDVRAFQTRQRQAAYYYDLPRPQLRNNGDEVRYLRRINSFSKALPHDPSGEVDNAAYNLLLESLQSGEPAGFDRLKLGGAARLQNPQGAYMLTMQGKDACQYATDPAPAFSSARQAAETIENYWRALTRDVLFYEYERSDLIRDAAADLGLLQDYAGPATKAGVTPQVVFRGTLRGDTVGPFISQFLYLPIPYGAATLQQRFKVAASGENFLTTYDEWLAAQNGAKSDRAVTFDDTPRYIRNTRDLASYARSDFSYQPYLGAALILLQMGSKALGDDVLYVYSQTEDAYVTFGAPNVLDVVSGVAHAALQAAWYQKWLIHRRARPEEFGGRVHAALTGKNNYAFHRDIWTSAAPKRVFDTTGSYLLPMAFPEGAPAHPAYPAGHAAMAGACVTVLKAFFNGDFEFPQAMQVNDDGTAIVPYFGPNLTVEGELHKLASNMSYGRDAAGIHYRGDGASGLALGEEVAINYLRDLCACYSESFGGFTFNRFDGRQVTVCGTCVL